jgi:lipopolysaccharide biosynthesis glycosyltransferase
MKEAIVVTLAIGDKNRFHYNTIFIPSIKAYASKWGFDFLCIDKCINEMEPTINIIYMQKFLIASIPEVQDYKYVIFIDADILCNAEAPNILEGIPEGKIAVVDEKSGWGSKELISRTLYYFTRENPSTAEEYYKFYNFPQSFSRQFNSGVFVFQPSLHKEFFQDLYNKYIVRASTGEDIGGDQAPFNYEANSRDLVYYMDERFNRLWIITWGIFYPFLNEEEHTPILKEAVKNIFSNTHFLHFAGRFGWNLLLSTPPT